MSSIIAALLVGVGAVVPSVRLLNGVEMPIMALGTGGYDNDTAEDAVLKASSLGLTHVHTAYDYYNLQGVGRGVLKAGDRGEIFVTAMTSPCIHPAAPPQRNVTDPEACYNLTKKELYEALESLGLEYVDLFLLHGPSEPFGYEGGCDEVVCALNQAQWRAYQDFLRSNLTRAIGVSNYCQSCLSCMMSDPSTVVNPMVNQIQWHVGMGPDPEGLMSYCEEKNVVVQAYSPLAGGEVVSDKLCASVGLKYNKTAAEVGLRWVVQQPIGPPALVVKSDSVKYLEQDLGVFDWALSKTDMDTLNHATEPKGQQDGHPSWGCRR